jgi:hypothetical protein
MEDQTIWCRFTKADFIDMLDKINNVSVVTETIAEVFRRSYVVTDKVVYNSCDEDFRERSMFEKNFD